MGKARALKQRATSMLLASSLALMIAGAPPLVVAQPAGAYSHEWGCVAGAYVKCYDNSGKTFNPWHIMAFSGSGFGGYCVKGETKSGGVIEFACASGVDGVSGRVCTGNETHAYGYSNLSSQFEVGTANTEGGC
jgi:hypothetical protein